jgi:hypothetical protein
MSSKATIIVDPALSSGSADLFRTAFGGFYITEDTDEGQAYSFVEADTSEPTSEDFDIIFSDIENQTTADYSNLVPSFSFPIRVASNSDTLESDQAWKTYVLGGPYGQKTYVPKFSNTVHEYLNISYNMPYEQREVLYLEDEDISDIVQISYDYTQHLADYESQISAFETELYIPNYYILSDFYRHKDVALEDTTKVYPSELVSFITFENQYETPEIVFEFNDSKIPYDVLPSEINSFTDMRKLNTDLGNAYLVSSLFSAPSEQTTIDWVTTKQKTILLDSEAITNLSDMQDYHDCLPYKMKITFPTKETGGFVDNFTENNFDSKILEALNEAFVTQQGLQTSEKNYIKSSEFKSGSIDTAISTVEEVNTVTYREINYIDFLTYCRDHYNSANSDYMFVGSNNIERLATTDTTGVYRHINTKNSLHALQYAINFLGDSSNVGVESIEDLFSQKTNYEETVAYRIEKIGGAGSGDGLSQNVLQNYWFLNSNAMADFEFFDSQVKFDSDYTYNIYAYVLTAGIKYEYSNLLLTRGLGCSDDLEEDLYGLEFYDPSGDEKNSQERLFDDDNYTDFNDSAGEGAYGSAAQIYSNYRYLADFKISYEPVLKMVEVPIYSKTLRILDNPPNRLNVVPYQIMDNSQKVAFDLYYGTNSEDSFPSAITNSDSEYKERYLNGKDLLSTTKISEESVSLQRTVEVYRTTTKPTSLEDFDGNLYKTISLKPPGEKFYRNAYDTCVSQIKTNQKYYYLFRVLNEHGTPGHISEIYETELINDGGYKFALFNTILESELGESPPPETSKQFKKIFQLRPNINQIVMDTADLDFEQSAESQISSLNIGDADDLIWDKTFKIRLTSKKTGKKIDLNITYKISGE